MRLARRVRASNTGTVIGWYVGPFSAWCCSRGTIDCYRNGIQVRYGQHRVVFIPTTRHRTLKEAA